MLFKPEENDDAKTADVRKPSLLSRILKRMVSLTITLVILGGLGYIGWLAWQQKQTANRGAGARPDLPVPVLAATPRVQDVPVYLDGVGSVRALNNVIVRAQVDGKLIVVNFVEGRSGGGQEGAG
jgi:multidrug efflux system membrane fusion protein